MVSLTCSHPELKTKGITWICDGATIHGDEAKVLLASEVSTVWVDNCATILIESMIPEGTRTLMCVSTRRTR